MLNIIDKYKEQLATLEEAQSQALKDKHYETVRTLSTDIYQLCNAICIEEGTPLKQVGR